MLKPPIELQYLPAACSAVSCITGTQTSGSERGWRTESERLPVELPEVCVNVSTGSTRQPATHTRDGAKPLSLGVLSEAVL